MSVAADEVVEIFEIAAEENLLSPLRNMQIVSLPAEGEVWMTGDIHDHRVNFNKLLKIADLRNNPKRHLVLHELIHGDHYDAHGAEDSWQTLYRAAELKADYPKQVHFLLANHDLAQIHGEGIMKGGASVCEAFTAGVKRDFGDRHGPVTIAITQFFLSLPLAIRCENGLFFSHSLPTDKNLETFDFTVFNRMLDGADYARRVGPIYQLVWGRNISPDATAEFAQYVEAKILVTGHQPQESGFLVNGPRHLIIASDHNQGVFLPIDLSQTYDMDSLTERLVKFVAVDVNA